MPPKNFETQKKILEYLNGKIDDFYLAGGTALSWFYFHHRESYDLDFFSKDFSRDRVIQIMGDLRKTFQCQIELVGQETRKHLAKMMVYTVVFKNKSTCRLDFVEDFVTLIKPCRRVDGINVLSLEDIYLRKILTVISNTPETNTIGQAVRVGGRQEAKDFYDLYCLSTISTPLSAFVARYSDSSASLGGLSAVREGLVQWYRTFDRMPIKTGLLDLDTSKRADFSAMDRHFKGEIDTLLSKGIEGK